MRSHNGRLSALERSGCGQRRAPQVVCYLVGGNFTPEEQAQLDTPGVICVAFFGEDDAAAHGVPALLGAGRPRV
jgi:hypothetical protein